MVLFVFCVVGLPVGAVYIGTDGCGGASIGMSAVRWDYAVNTTGVLTEFYITANDLYGAGSGINLDINGQAVGYPTRHDVQSVNCSTYDGYYWDNISILLADEYIYFELSFPNTYTLNLQNSNDEDGDGDTTFELYYSGSWHEYVTGDPTYWCIVNVSATTDYTDLLLVEPDSVSVHSPVHCLWSSGLIGVDNYCVITNALGVEVYNVTMSYPVHEVYFYPETVGVFSVYLNRSAGAVASDSFTSVSVDYYHYVTFDPNPALPKRLVSVDILFNYTSFDGLLQCNALGLSFFVNGSNVVQHRSFVSPNLGGDYDFELFAVDSNGVKIYSIDSFPFYCRGVNYFSPYLNLKLLNYNYDADDDMNFRINYGYPFIGFNGIIRIRSVSANIVLNDIFVSDNVGTVYWTDVFHYDGIHTLQLIVDGNVLAQTSFVRTDDGISVVDSNVTDEYNVIIGILISLGVGIGVLVVTKNQFAFLGVSAVMVYILAQPSLGSYNLLPNEVSYGLIVVLVLIGALIWLLD